MDPGDLAIKIVTKKLETILCCPTVNSDLTLK